MAHDAIVASVYSSKGGVSLGGGAGKSSANSSSNSSSLRDASYDFAVVAAYHEEWKEEKDIFFVWIHAACITFFH